MRLPDEVEDWPIDAWVEYHERAGIIEHDGGVSREKAERMAEELVRRSHDTRRDRRGAT